MLFTIGPLGGGFYFDHKWGILNRPVTANTTPYWFWEVTPGYGDGMAVGPNGRKLDSFDMPHRGSTGFQVLYLDKHAGSQSFSFLDDPAPNFW